MQNLIGQSETRVFYELAPMIPMSQWWHLVLLVAGSGMLLWLIVARYRRDSIALPGAIGYLLTSLRVLAFLGLLVFILGPQRRSETRVVKPSELSVLIDTSLSMGLTDSVSAQTDQARRIDSVVQLLSASPLINQLNANHQVTVYRFGNAAEAEEIVTLEKALPVSKQSIQPSTAGKFELNLQRSRRVGWMAIVALAASLILLTSTIIIRWLMGMVAVSSFALALGSLLMVAGTALLATTDLISSEFNLWTSLGWTPASLETTRQPAAVNLPPENTATAANPVINVDWNAELAPHATSTRLGQAVQEIVNQKRGGASAGIVIFTDGRNNAGPPPSRAIAAASDAHIPIYVVGIGSNRPARNVRVSDLQAPRRVFPGDKFRVKSMIQSYGMTGESVRVQLISSNENDADGETVEDEQSVRLIEDGQPLRVEFEVSQLSEGRQTYSVRVEPPIGDLDNRDNQRWTTVEVLLRKTKVLLVAGGPMRDYQFLRNQLFRDEDVVLDVWLQMARPGADQESDELIFDFPKTRKAMFDYDCLVAFDPDWRKLSLVQARLLERWVSEKAGGMIVIAGPVFTPEWTRKPRGDESIDLIRRLYPVSFYSQGSSALKLGRFGGERPFPLQFSREGRSAQHLSLGDSALDSAANWQKFKGVFGYYAVNEGKAGADILAYFSDPSTAIDERLPIYLASHFYGSGRVFFQASGEIWRLRDVDVAFFQDYYLNLIRWVSQGRLLRDSTRGVLLLDRNRCWVGDQVVVRAILRDASDMPLVIGSVKAVVLRPDGVSQTIELNSIPNAVMPGTFSGQFLAPIEGDYRISLPIPQSSDGQVLRAELQANIPDLEKERPERNDVLLQEMARKTGGIFVFDLSADGKCRFERFAESNAANRTVSGRKPEFQSIYGDDGLPSLIDTVDQETYLPGTPDQLFTRKSLAWLLGWLTLVLGTEWTIRRLHKLA